jgi:hypothetical protein
VAQRYEERFRGLDWTQVAEIDEDKPQVGHLPHPQSAYIKAYLVMIDEGFGYMTHLHQYLSEHPALVWLLGFRLKPAEQPTGVGFDVVGSLPTVRHLRRKLPRLDPDSLTGLLKQTVQQALAVMPDVGQTVSIDTKHIYADVQENNPRAYVNDRFNPTRQPRADPDCRLGAKRSTNQTDEQGNAKTKTEWLWGYGSGIVVGQTPDKDALVLAEYTQTFDRNDVTYALPLLHAAQTNLGFAPPNLTADAAFDAWYVYQWSAERDGIAAIALNLRGHPLTVLGEHDCPICTCNAQEMTPCESWIERDDGHREQRFRCQSCGVIRKMIVEAGHLMRLRLNRHAEPYRSLYQQRTATERINAQAHALGIDHPHQRSFQAITRRNTLCYILINLRALARFHERSLNLSLSFIAA